jgi:hypothetical protein
MSDLSKLSTYELQAIANNDFSKLSESTLNMLAGGVNQASAQQLTTQPQEPVAKPMSGGQVLSSAVMNFPSSLFSMATDVFKAVTDPLQTARDLGTLFVGATSKVLGEPLFESDKGKQMRLKGEKSVEQVGTFIANRYGSIENAKQALATDPAGVLSDASLVFTGGAGILPKASMASKALSTAAKVTDPLRIAAAPIAYGAKGVAPFLGMTTGAGSMAIEEAYKAGKAGGEKGKSFVGNLRGTADQLQVLEDTKSNLKAMIEQQQQAYRSGMIDVKADQSILKFNDIDSALQKANDRIYYKGTVRSKDAAGYLTDTQKIIDEWKANNPADFHTPEGLDILKQKIYDDVLSNIPINQKSSIGIIGDIYNSVKSTIQKQAPTYAETMKAYADTAEQVREIEKSLSQGRKATADAGLRKLQTVLRDNASTNYGQRVKLIDQLEATSPQYGGGIPIKPALAGQALSKVTPRGMQAVGTVGTAGLLSQVGSNPLAAAYLAGSSPRLVGEAAYLAGKGARQAENVGGLFPNIGGLLPGVDYPVMFNLLSRTQTE